MKYIVLIFACIASILSAQAQGISDKNYRIYSVKDKKEVALQDIIAQMDQYDVLFYGEEHDDSVTHYLEATLLKMLFEKYGSKTALSLEMFDRDVQNVMNEYLKGFISERHFNKDARVWSNYKDYKPMVEFAKLNSFDVVCANAASRYTNVVGKKGQAFLLNLPKSSLNNIAPLPYDTASGGYYEKLMALSGHSTKDTGTKDTAKKMPVMAMGNFNMITSQSLWDATMAYSIASYMKTHKGYKMMQVNGRFHSDEKFAIVTQLKKYGPKLKPLVISSGRDENFPNIKWEDYINDGDYIIITDPKVPATYK